MATKSSTPAPPRNATYTSSPRPGQQNVFARFQALFPTNSSAAAQSRSAPPTHHAPSLAFLKIRILTWNMHDTVPKGDLTDLLGSVSPYTPPNPSLGESSFPRLESDASHPYHLVVVAGQECPTMSGFPKGLSAGFKLVDKDKDPIKDTERDRNHPASKLWEKEKDEVINRWKHFSDSHESLGHQHSGWTSMVEDWLCQTAGSCGHASTSPVAGSGSNGTPKISSPALGTPKKDEQKGPYQLLIKERLMGIYMAIYIHRDIRDLVQGTSKAAVAAGLIGGRVGNKGGVGISLNLSGTTFLFINAHLAAHCGRQNYRLANLAKINSELSVETFLKPDDARLVAEDITDRFDYTFFCGDLNFRLDISRLHADWLIARQEYAQALAFDQLKKVMEKQEAFVGFKEARINFPPTFKYDVMRTLKRQKDPKHHSWNHISDRANHLIIEVDEHDPEELDDDGVDDEAASTASSVVTSNSRPEISGDEDYLQVAPSSHTVSTPGSRISFAIAASKAKAKWLKLLSPTSPRKVFKLDQPRTPRTPRTPNSQPQAPKAHTPNGLQNFLTSLQTPTRNRVFAPDTEHHEPSSSASPTKHDHHHVEDDDAEDKGVYDSSHKQRVPSWCDRILWKSTVKPDPDLDGAGIALQPRSKTLVGQLFAFARRPLSARNRNASDSSIFSGDLRRASPSSERPSRSPTVEITETDPQTAVPSGDFDTSPRSDGLKHFHSNEDLRPKKPQLTRQPVRGVDRSRRATLGVYLPYLAANPPERLVTDIPPAAAAIRSAGLPNRNSTRYASLPTPFRWRFLPFLSRDSTTIITSEPDTLSEPLPPPRKGDVVCLSYDTLDDRAMRRLEGRSDHRPVIGSYAVYI